MSPLMKNTRVDTMLTDVFSLLSLFFLTVGRNRECPAIFSQIASMKQLLDHMSEASVYTEADLQPFTQRIKELHEIIKKDERENKHPLQLTKLMMRKLEGCQQVLSKIESSLSVLSVELLPIHQKLVQIRRELLILAANPKPAKADVKALQEELRNIESYVVLLRPCSPQETRRRQIPRARWLVCARGASNCRGYSRELLRDQQ